MKPTYEELEAQCAMMAAENIFKHDVLVRLAKARPGGTYFIKWEALIADALNYTATSDFLAEIKAQGVDAAIEQIQQTISENHEVVLREFAAQLRRETTVKTAPGVIS